METAGLWLLTYLLHSSVLLGAAVLLRLALGERRLSLQEAALRAALVGGFATASLQLGLGVRPLGGTVALPAARPLLVSSPATPPEASRWEAAPAHSAVKTTGAAQAPRPLDPTSGLADQAARGWRLLLVLAWGVLGLLALSRLAVAATRLRRLLHHRRRLSEQEVGPGARVVADALGLRRLVKLSTAPHLVVPLTTGVLRPEVFLPLRALDEMADEERLALCAHELAHVARRDPAWTLLGHLVEVIAPLQPLNLWARRRLQDLAECLSDDLAVAASGRPLGLARSLVDVASWTLAQPVVQPALAAGAVTARSRVGHRVERLMDPLRALERPRRMLLPLALVAVLATAFLTPVVSGGPAQAPKPPAVPTRPTPDATPREASGETPQPAPQPTPRPVPDAHRRTDAKRELERVAAQMERRSREHEAEMTRLEAEIDALASKMKPDEREMQRLSREIEQAAREVAEHMTEPAEGHEGQAAAEKRAEARRRMAELTAEMRASVQGLRLPEAEMRDLQEKARVLADLVKPTEEERRALQTAARELARASMPDSAEIARMAEEAVAQARATADEARGEACRAREEAQRAAAEAKKVLEREKP
jgi:beta-lactamase regulating signal transducer with metallopeptidase domain